MQAPSDLAYTRRRAAEAAIWGHYEALTPFEEASNYSGVRGDARYLIRRGLRAFVYRNLNVGSVDPRLDSSTVVFSIRAGQNASPALPGYDRIRNGRVIHHARNVAVADAALVVEEGYAPYWPHTRLIRAGDGKGGLRWHPGRSLRGDPNGHGWRGVRANGHKNVHAGVSGTLLSWGSIALPEDYLSDPAWDLLTYDPRLHEAFQRIDKASLGTGILRVLGPAHRASLVLMASHAGKPLLLARDAL